MGNVTKDQAGKISRRHFAQRAVVLAASGSIVVSGVAAAAGAAVGEATEMEASAAGAGGQEQPALPKLGPAGQVEADARLQGILALHGNEFDEQQKALLKTMCVFLQPALEHVRAYPLNNGDAPALHLHPLVEREKKPANSHSGAPGAAKNS